MFNCPECKGHKTFAMKKYLHHRGNMSAGGGRRSTGLFTCSQCGFTERIA